jgi:hypothetical protein
MDFPLELLVVRQMASGESSLLLTDRVPWESFPGYAEAVLRIVGGSIVERVDSPVERIWTVLIEDQLFWLAHDQVGVSLDSKSRESSLLIRSIRETLLAFRSV